MSLGKKSSSSLKSGKACEKTEVRGNQVTAFNHMTLEIKTQKSF